MNKGFIIRASVILGLFLTIIVVAIGCEFFVNKDQINASLSNPDEVYFSLDNGIEVTNQELWDVMKNVEGIQYLEEYVDRMLLATYISAVTPEEVEKEVTILKYGTTDVDKIAEIQEDQELHDRFIESFEQNIKVLGFDPTDEDDLRAFVELGIAKRNYAIEQILLGEDESLAVSDQALRGYYESQNKGSVCTIDLRFGNSNEASAVFDLFNLVPTYTDGEGNTGIGLYDPNLNLDDENNPILITDESLKKSDFTDDNTDLLDEDEVFTYYVKMWNHLNQYETAIDESETRATFCANYPEIGVKVYDEMIEDKSSQDPLVRYASKIFDSMDLNNDGFKPYSYGISGTYGEFMILTYKLEQTDLLTADLEFVLDDESKIESVTFASTEAETAANGLDFVGLTESEAIQLFMDTLAAPLRNEYIEEVMATDTLVNTVVRDLRVASNLTIHDYQMRLRLESNAASTQGIPLYTLNNKGSQDFVASYDGKDITPDDLLEFMLDRVGIFYAIELAKSEVLLNSSYYTDMFGTSKDVFGSENENMQAVVDEVEQMKASFVSGLYAQYGFSPTEMEWEEFIYLAFQLTSVEDLAMQVYVVGDIKPGYVNDHVNYEGAVAYMQDQVDRFLSLNVNHLLLYVDRDFDLQPDDFSDFLEDLSVQDLDTYNLLTAQFEADVLNEMNVNEKSFTTIVSEFKNATAGDGSIWAPYKEFGFFIQTQGLGEVDQNSIDNYDEVFADELVRLYSLYTDVNEKDKTSLLSDRVIETDFGVHLVEVKKGTNFNMPTAVYNYIDAEEEVGTYVEGSEGDSVIPTLAQVEAYIAIQEAIANGETPGLLLPDSVTEAIEYYFGPVYNAYQGNTGFGIIIADFMFENGLEFNVDNSEELEAKLEAILEVYYEISFPELFDPSAE